MAVEVADLIARLRADIRDFSGKFDQAGQALKKFETATQRTQASIQQFGTQLGVLPGPLGAAASGASRFAIMLTGPVGIAVGVGLVLAGLGKLIHGLTQTGDELAKLSAKTGVTVETLSSLKLASELANVSLQETGQGLKFLQRAMVEASTGNQELQQLFRALGVGVKTGGQFREVESVLEDVARSMQHLGSDAERTRVAMALFGRAGVELLPVLKDIADRGLAGMTEEAKRLGVFLSGDAARAAEQFQDNLTRLGTAFSGLTRALLNDVIPSLSIFIDKLTTAISRLTTFWISLNQGVKTALQPMDEFFERASRLMDKFISDMVRGLFPTFESARERAARLFEELRDLQRELQTPRFGGITIALPDPAALKALEAMQTLLDQMTLSPLAADAAAFEHQMDEFAKVSGPAGVALIQKLRSTFALIMQMKIGQAFAQDWEQVKKELDDSKARVAEIGIGFGLLEPTLEDLGNYLGLMGHGFEAMNPELAKANAWSASIVNAWVLAGRQLSLFPEGWRKTQAEVEALLRLIQMANEETAALGFPEDVTRRHLLALPSEEEEARWKAFTTTILGAMDQMVIGVLQGTQTIEQAFERMLDNILLALMSAQLTKALQPVLEDFGKEFETFMTAMGTEGGNALGTAFGQSLAFIGTAMVASQINKINQDPGANKAAGEIGTSIGAALGLGLGIALSAYLGPLGPVIGMALGSAIGGAIGRGINKEIASIGPELQARLNDIFAPWFAQFKNDMAILGEEAGQELLTGVQKGAEAIGLRSLVRELGFEKMHAKDFERLLKPILEATATAVSEGFKKGMAAPSAEEGFVIFKQSIYKSVIDGLIVALSQGVIFQQAMAPIVAMLQTQTAEGLIKGFAEALNFLMEQLALLEPVFEELFSFIHDMATLLDVTIEAPEMPSIETEAADLTNEINQFLKDLQRLIAEIQGLDAEVANLNTDLALTQMQIDRTRVELETATDPSEILDLAGQLMDLTMDYYETQMDLATALHDELLALVETFNQGLSSLVTLNLQFSFTSEASLRVATVLAGIIDAMEDVGTAALTFIAIMDAVGQAFVQAATAGDLTAVRAAIDAILTVVGSVPDMISAIQTIPDPQAQLDNLALVAAGLESLYQDVIAGIQAAYNWLRREAQEVSQARIDALRNERDAIMEMTDAQLEAARETLQVVQEWKRVAETLRNYLLDLQLGPLAPPNPMAAFGIAQSEFDAAVAAFRAGGTPQTAQAVQEMAQRLLQEASEVFARPSPEYAALFTSITSILDEVSAIAQEQAATEEELLAEIKSLDEQRNAQLAGIDAAIKAEQEALTATLERLSAEEQQLFTEAQTLFATAFAALNDAMVEALIALDQQIIDQTAQLEAVIGEGNTYEAFIADLTQQEVDALHQIDADLKALLTALGISYAEGTTYVPKTGPYVLHEGEQVIPAGESAGSSVYFAPGAIVISGVSDPEKASDLVMEKFYRSLRGGKGRRIVEKIK